MRRPINFFVFSLVAFVAMLSIQTGFAQDAGPFPDVGGSHPNVIAIRSMKTWGIFTGYPDGTFQPDRVLNRAEQLKVYMLLQGIDPDASTNKNCFPDVAADWYAKYVCYAKSHGIVEGYPDGFFRPAQEVNKAEALKMLGGLQAWELASPVSMPFEDVAADAWFAPYVMFAKEHHLLEETGVFYKPADGITRAATAELMFRSLAVSRLELPYDPSLSSQIEELDISPTQTGNVTTPDHPVVTNFVTSPENGKAEAGFPYDVTFSVLAPDGTPVENADLEIYFWQPYVATNDDGTSPVQMFDYQSLGGGQYHVQVSNIFRGDNILVIKDKASGFLHREPVTFLAGDPYELKILDVEGPEKMSLGTRTFVLALEDQYNNVIPGAKFSGSTQFGELTFSTGADGTATATFVADGYGGTNLQFSAELNGVVRNETYFVDVLPFGLGGYPGYEATDEITKVPVLFFVPKMGAATGSFQVELEIPGNLSLVGFTPSASFLNLLDIDQTLNETGDRVIQINGQGLGGMDTFDGRLGDIVLQGFPEGEVQLGGSVRLSSENPSYTETLYRGGNTRVQQNNNELYVSSFPRPFPAINGKSEKRICIDVFIEPGSGVTIDMVNADVKQTEDIFYKNAQSCNCAHFLRIDVFNVPLNANTWSVLSGGDGYVGSSDILDLVRTGTPIPPHRACTPVFYTDDLDEIGLSHRSAETDELSQEGKMGAHIKVNNAKDHDGRAFAHELAHHLSGNSINDPKDGLTQGAGSDGNLMSYDEVDEDGNLTRQVAGDDLTKTQCDLISWDHWRFSAYPPN